MAFVGYIASVIAKKANDARKERRKASFKQRKYYGTGLYKSLVDHKKMNRKDFIAFREELQRKSKIKSIKNIIILVLSVIITITIVYNFIEYLKSI